MIPALPLSDDEGAALFDSFFKGEQEKALALAVSGGPDSMALALCAGRWAASRGVRLHAFLVDHDLRPGSADEARQAAATLTALGVPAEILFWAHPPLDSRLERTARDARFALLEEACRKAAISTLALAHHQDDQAETVLMRLAKGSGIAGLGGMASESWRGALRLIRPFLALPKARLLATCEAAALPFATDPTNEGDGNARARLRGLASLLAGEGLTPARLADLADRAREAQEVVALSLSAFLKAHARQSPYGTLTLDRAALKTAPRALALGALASCLGALASPSFPLPRRKLLGLLDELCAEGPTKARSLAGCLAQRRPELVTFFREASCVQGPLPLRPGETILWDAHWQIQAPPDFPPDVVVKALGFQTHARLNALAPGLHRAVPQGRARGVLPGLWREGALWAIPSFGLAAPPENAALVAAWPRAVFV